ncbi:MAG TPA: type II secretion system F family protein [Planctomycetota bacterium]|nr:type II secretion system F family protein [Planctomycetota bacterium]
MAQFTYEARSADGKKIDGSVKAADRNAAMDQIKKKNLTVVQLVEDRGLAAKRTLFGRPPRARVKTKEICIITRQLSTMISAGIPLLESLEILCEQATDAGFRRVMDRIIERVRSGTDFSTALSEHPKIFSNIFVNMIKAGEASGNLDVILTRLAEYLESIEEIKREVKAAMVYPTVSLTMILAITTGLVVGIVPKFKVIFEQLGMTGDDLPVPTKILLQVSWFLQNQFLLLVGMIIAVVVGFVMFKRSKPGMKIWHRFLLNMPLFGQLFRKVAISRFARTFSTLIQSGVPILGALDIVAGTAGNVIIEEAVLRAKDAVSRGETLGEPLAATKVFPPMVTRMIAIGEKTGALEKLLSKISDFYDAEVKAAVKAITSLIEPLMIGIMGMIVGGIVLAIFMPIIKLQQTLGSK